MVRWLRGPDALDQLGDRFDALVEFTAVPLVARRTWLQTWSDTYRDHEPWVAVVDGPDGRLDACAMLARRMRGGILDINNLGRGPTDYTFFPARDAAAGAELAGGVVDGLRALRQPWRVRVEQLPAGDPVAAAVASGLRVAAVVPGDPSPVVALRPGTSADAYMSSRMRRSVRTAANRLARDGVVAEYNHVTEPVEIGAYLPELEAVWRERDHLVGRRSDADDPAGLGFFLAAVRGLAERGEVELTVLLLDGALAAFAVCLLDAESHQVWIPRIAPRFAAYNPGHLVNRSLVARALERGCAQLDWMRGEEPYKLETANCAIEHEHL
ncbi:MAG TPA: GNAT family N-acetyltransferase, partial [Acidimicrobiales bacterium]|nr:GNAT family N-acetyltransferase [Acidimicrobiales bacterium]